MKMMMMMMAICRTGITEMALRAGLNKTYRNNE